MWADDSDSDSLVRRPGHIAVDIPRDPVRPPREKRKSKKERGRRYQPMSYEHEGMEREERQMLIHNLTASPSKVSLRSNVERAKATKAETGPFVMKDFEGLMVPIEQFSGIHSYPTDEQLRSHYASHPDKKEDIRKRTPSELQSLMLVFSFSRATVFRTAFVPITISLVIAIVATVLFSFYPNCSIPLTAHTLSIIPLSFLVVLKSNSSYQRFCSGRDCLRRQKHALSEAISMFQSSLKPTVAREGLLDSEFLHYTTIFVVCMRQALVDFAMPAGHESVQKYMQELAFFGADKDEVNRLEVVAASARPTMVLSWLRQLINRHSNTCFLSIGITRKISKHVTEAHNAWFEMQSLATAFMPFPYVHMLKVLLCIWVFSVPFALTAEMARGSGGYGLYFTAPVTLILSMALFGIEAIGEELENPLGLDLNDLSVINWERDLIFNCKKLMALMRSNTNHFNFSHRRRDDPEEPMPIHRQK